ncbi:MAG: YdcF family protein [Chloroflexota bacterium]|nr:MAG: YdcF family protein [Chloroflexota bacterium]
MALDRRYYWIPRRLIRNVALGAGVTLLIVLISLGWVMRSLGTWLDVGSSPLAASDAIVVLGGGQTHGSREARAAELFRSGIAPLVVTTGGPVAGEREATYAAWSVERLERRGVPRAAILSTNLGDSTVTDARGALRLARERGWTRIAIVTDNWHSRRAALVFDAIFRGSGVDVSSAPATPPRVDLATWWLDETTALFVVSEYIKLAYLLPTFVVPG